ncbi:hypothetical protein TWF506_006657 [Arthrobotrys conoides]|uniref:Uncharacterized protein n=1 Tax=Arthrobotrys conoides TaxID=74498 RepID=A0AAN8RP56_9PEZI
MTEPQQSKHPRPGAVPIRLPLPVPFTTSEIIEALRNEPRFPQGYDFTHTEELPQNPNNYNITTTLTADNNNNNHHTPRPSSSSSSSFSSSKPRTPVVSPNNNGDGIYKIVLGKMVDRNDAYYKGDGSNRRILGSRSDVNDGLDKDFAMLEVVDDDDHDDMDDDLDDDDLDYGDDDLGNDLGDDELDTALDDIYEEEQSSLLSAVEKELDRELEARCDGAYIPPPPPAPSKPSRRRPSQNPSPTLPSSSSSSPTAILPPSILSQLFFEITYIHQNFRIHPMSPLTRQIFAERGYKPTSEFIIEDDGEPAQIMRTESGWWAWDLKGEYVCFVTGDDVRFVNVLREVGGMWGKEVEGVWEGW